MALTKRYWCPKNGCGKKIYFEHRTEIGYSSIFKCDKCGWEFSGSRLELLGMKINGNKVKKR